MSVYLILALLLILLTASNASISSIGYRPKGHNPLLYEPGEDPILHLDADTFADTVLRPDKDKAYLVEFYKDWCGYCRRFMPWYKVLADAVKSWPFVQIAAINCADAFNVKICRANDIPTVPKLKYFSRNATSFADGQVIEHSYNNAIDMREQLHQKLMDEFHKELDSGHGSYYLGEMPYQRKCNLASLCNPSASTAVNNNNNNNVAYTSAFSYDVEGKMEDPWKGVPSSTQYLVSVFERNPERGIPVSMELLFFKPGVEVKRVLVWDQKDVLMPAPAPLPYVIILQRGKPRPVLAESITDATIAKFHQLFDPMKEEINSTEQAQAHSKKPLSVINCDQNPEKCKQMFYVSETDMLKSIHTALLDEVISSGGDELDPEHIANLQNFLDLLIQRFPRKTFERSQPLSTHPKAVALGKSLARSQRAIQVFDHMKQFLEAKASGGHVTMDEWKTEFDNAKRQYEEPFPLDANWEHCKGSRPIFRGFTCGLWTTFHAMTVQAYLAGEKEPLKPLKSIQGWVKSFFSCSGCRKHFMEMTTEKYPLDSNNVKSTEDIVVYLWKAHNIVNQRLHNDEATEDPQFPKEQFPPAFLCSECRNSNGDLDQQKTFQFLLQFSTNVKPQP